MLLRVTPVSPFARKVRVTVLELGLQARVQIFPTTLRTRDEVFWAQNPLARVPVLETDDGEAITDSHVICEYLDAVHGAHRLLPAHGPGRWRALSLAAMTGGMVEAAMMVRRESQRPPEQADPAVIAYEQDKVWRGLDRLQRDVALPMLSEGHGFEHAEIAAACTVGWLAFRLGHGFTFDGRPELLTWWSELVEPRPSMQATAPR
jgi:glutathione S-transferase